MDANEVNVKFSMNPDESVKQTQRILQNVAQSLDNIGKRSQAVSAQMSSVGESLQQNAALMSRRIRAGFLFMTAGPLINFVKRAFTVTESIYDMAQATGMSTQQINQMQGAFALAGIEVARTNNLIMALNSSMLRAQLRIKYMGKIPRELMPIQGLLPSITNGASLDKTLFALSDRLAQLSRREARGVLQGLGIADARIQDMLSHGRRVLQEYLERGKKLTVINDRLIDNTWELRKAWVSTSYSIRMSAMDTFGAVAPVLGSLGGIISDVAQHIQVFKPLLFVGAVTALSTMGYWMSTMSKRFIKAPGKLFGGAVAGALALNDLDVWRRGGKSALPNVWQLLFGTPEKLQGAVNTGMGMLKEVTSGAGELFDGVAGLWKTMGLGGELPASAMLGWFVGGSRGAVIGGTTSLALERQMYLKQLEERKSRGETLSAEEQTHLNMSNFLETSGKVLASIFGPLAKTGSLTPAVGEAIYQVAEMLAIDKAKKTGKPVEMEWATKFMNGPMGKTLLLGAHFSTLLGGQTGMAIGILVSIAMGVTAIWGVVSDWWKEHTPSRSDSYMEVANGVVELFRTWYDNMSMFDPDRFSRLTAEEQVQDFLKYLSHFPLSDDQRMKVLQNAANDPSLGPVLNNLFAAVIDALDAASALNPGRDAVAQRLDENVGEMVKSLDIIKRNVSSIERKGWNMNGYFDAYEATYSEPYTLRPVGWGFGLDYGTWNSDGSLR